MLRDRKTVKLMHRLAENSPHALDIMRRLALRSGEITLELWKKHGITGIEAQILWEDECNYDYTKLLRLLETGEAVTRLQKNLASAFCPLEAYENVEWNIHL